MNLKEEEESNTPSNLKHNNPRVILFLGAGASNFAGYFTFASFPELLLNAELRQREKMPELSQDTSRILKAIKDSLERGYIPTTHDNFLWRLESYSNLLRQNLSDDVLQYILRENTKLHDLFISTERAINQISRTTVHHYSENRVTLAKLNDNANYIKMKSVFEFYKELAKFNGSEIYLPIFTTNYDMLIEDLHEEFSIEATKNDILRNGILNRITDSTPWSYKHYSSDGLQLFRLHGCVSWFYHTREDSNVYFHRKDAITREMNKMCAMYPGRETRLGMDPHKLAFNNLYKSLKNCDLAVFIGFSFRDDDVMHVLLKALSERIGKPKLLIIDPVYHSHDIQIKLHDSATRTAFPSKIPKNDQIKSILSRFGDDNQDLSQIIDSCKKMLN